ncbi:hypothetical protein AVEN_220449-1, partial [Araneus ventricosus]
CITPQSNFEESCLRPATAFGVSRRTIAATPRKVRSEFHRHHLTRPDPSRRKYVSSSGGLKREDSSHLKVEFLTIAILSLFFVEKVKIDTLQFMGHCVFLQSSVFTFAFATFCFHFRLEITETEADIPATPSWEKFASAGDIPAEARAEAKRITMTGQEKSLVRLNASRSPTLSCAAGSFYGAL